MTAPVTITIPDNHGVDHEIRAWLTLVPGLVVHPSLGDPGWIVTHQRSGLLLVMVEDPESAQAIAVELGAIADWTLSAVELHALGISRAALDIRNRCIPCAGIYGKPIDRNEVSA